MKKSIISVIVLMFFTCPLWAQNSVDGGKKAQREIVAQELEGFNLSGYSEGGQKSWDIKGDKAHIHGDDVAVTNVNAYSYGKENMNVTAKEGNIDKATGDVNLKRDVVVTAESGATLKTETLQWQRNNDLVQTNDKVRIEDKGMTVSGQGMEAHPSLKDAKLRSDVTADILSEGKDKKADNRIQITCDGSMEVDQATQSAVFTNNAVAIEISTGRKVKSDRMEVKFDKDSRKIKEIICTGNVEVHQGMNITYSETLVYKADEQRMIMTGKPKLLIDPGDKTSSAILNY
ncbi:MAG: LPS export ABC transporter periplasmic protein LptC [Candidatus Omnitrophica bacterium]|nr:LPS export ABC transporter periplasmic protein LptC [Candidatus Omnitrophota bacterium]